MTRRADKWKSTRNADAVRRAHRPKTLEERGGWSASATEASSGKPIPTLDYAEVEQKARSEDITTLADYLENLSQQHLISRQKAGTLLDSFDHNNRLRTKTLSSQGLEGHSLVVLSVVLAAKDPKLGAALLKTAFDETFVPNRTGPISKMGDFVTVTLKQQALKEAKETFTQISLHQEHIPGRK